MDEVQILASTRQIKQVTSILTSSTPNEGSKSYQVQAKVKKLRDRIILGVQMTAKIIQIKYRMIWQPQQYTGRINAEEEMKFSCTGCTNEI